MVLHGHVQDGTVVVRDGIPWPTGTAVCITPEPTERGAFTEAADDRLSENEHRRRMAIMDRIAALPVEGSLEPFSGADHDRILYGSR